MIGRAPSQAELAAQVGKSRTAVTQCLTILERKGLVTLPKMRLEGELAFTPKGLRELRGEGKR